MANKYRVLVGHHSERQFETDANGERKKDHDGNFIYRDVLYGQKCAAGDVFETDQDMLRHNAPGMAQKFALVAEEHIPDTVESLQQRIARDQQKLTKMQKASPQQPATAKVDPHVASAQESNATRTKQLGAMSLKQLQDIAASEEIDVSTCKSRDDYIRAILAK